MLKIERLTKQFGSITAVDDMSFEAGGGFVFGLLGPNGAGKSTTISCISGLLKPTSGSIQVAGFDIATSPRQARQALGVVPQELALYEDLPAVDNLKYWGRAYGLRGSELDSRVAEVLSTIGLVDRASDLPKTFSGGMKRRLNFGCGVVHQPPVMLLDEPTVGVDPQSRERLFELVEAERDRGTCIIYTTHYMEEAERLCDSVGIIDHGKLVAKGRVEEMRAQLGARDVLQLSGHFDVAGCEKALRRLSESSGLDLEVLSLDESGLTLTMSGASEHLHAILQSVSETEARITATSLRSPNLETLFLLLTGKELRE